MANQEHSDTERLNWLITNPGGATYLFRKLAPTEPTEGLRQIRIRMTIDDAINGGWSDKDAEFQHDSPSRTN